MNLRRLLAPTVVLVAALPAAGLAAPAADAAGTCTPSITMGKPYQDPGGMVFFPASYTLCESSRVAIKDRDRDVTPVSWGGGSSGGVPAGTGTTWVGTCAADGQPHRWVAYGTVKTNTGGTLLAQSAKVYFVSKAVKHNCKTPLSTPPAS